MAISLRHKFQSAKGDGPDNTVVQPGDWNDEHNLTLASNKVLGRVTTSPDPGPVEEVAMGAYGRQILATADVAAFNAVSGSFPTGAVMQFLGSGVLTGWVRGNARTIGNGASGATERANADCQSLFVFIYGAFNDTVCPVSGGRSGIALNDFNANKTIRLPDLRGRQLIGDDVMGNAAANVVPGAVVGSAGAGAQTHTIAVANLPASQINVTVDPSGGHAHTYKNTTQNARTVQSGTGATIQEAVNPASDNANTSAIANHAHPARTDNLGSGTALNAMDPYWVVTHYIKL